MGAGKQRSVLDHQRQRAGVCGFPVEPDNLGCVRVRGRQQHEHHGGAAALNASDLYRAARQVAHDAAGELGLGVNVAQLHAGRVTYILNAEGRFSPRSFSLTGRTQPAHATGLGKALVCEHSEASLIELVGTEPLQSFTPFTITTIDALIAALAAVRQCGYATEIEELAFGRACIAAPIRAAGGVIVGAISLSGPLRILDLEHRLNELGRHAIEAADAIAASLDFEPARVVLRG